MKFFEKYTGELPRLVHSPAEYGLRGEPMQISAACRVQNGSVPDRLFAFVKNGGGYPLLPSDSLTLGGVSYEIYTGEIPPKELQGSDLCYAVGEKGFFSDLSDFYRVNLLAAETLPAQPPLCVTEIYGRPKGRGIGAYLEVKNPSDAVTDLYDYEFLIFEGIMEPSAKPTCRFPMADAPGTLLQPGEYAAIWGITPANTDKSGREWCTPEDFFEDFTSDYNHRGLDYSVDSGRVIPVRYYTVDEMGAKKLLPGIADMPVKHKPSYLCIVPRGADASAAVFHMVYSTVYGSWDTPVKRSSYWRTDPRRPDEGVNICHYAVPTPGFPGKGQGSADLRSPLPLLIPFTPDRSIYISDGDCEVAFAAVPTAENGRVAGASVCVSLGEETRVFDAAEGDDGFFRAVLPAALVRSSRSLTFWLQATDGMRDVSTRETPVTVAVMDNAGPFVDSMLPTEGYAYDGTLGDAVIRASFTDISGTDLSGCSLTVDGKDVTAQAEWTAGSVVLHRELEAGEHALTLTLRDCLGNVSERNVGFSVSDMKELGIFRGEVHSHTSESDGTGMPEDAYAYARDIGEADYFAVTDHSHYIDSDKYDHLLQVADEFDKPGSFAALYGWEMTYNNGCGYWGHVNVLNTREFLQRINDVNMPDLFVWLHGHPEAIGMFNHPGYPWGNFDEYGHRTPEADAAMRLSEIRTFGYDFEYMNSLREGWHASPVSNEDNHAPNWTTATNSDGFVLAPALTRQNVVDAFRANRTYTASDRTMKILYRVNGQWLGSHLDNPEKLRFDISVTTEKPTGIGVVQILAEDGMVVATKNASGLRELHWKPVLSPEFDYYYLRITGMGQYCVTAPVWIENRGAPQVNVTAYNASFHETDTAAVTARVANTAEDAMNDVRVSFYLSAQAGFRLYEAEPFRTVCCGRMKPGAILNVSALLPEIEGLRRVTVIVSAETKDGRRCGTDSAMLIPVTVTGVLPKSSETEREGETVKNPFPYLTLYNSSPVDFRLDGYRLCPWITTGKQPPERRILPLDGITVKARSTVVLWDRSTCPELTADDFNARYGTSLTEGETLFPTATHILDAAPEGRRLDLRFGDSVLTRVHWNYGLEYTGSTETDTEHRYVYRPNITGTAAPAGTKAPCPGAVDEEQAGRQRTVLPGRKDKKRAAKAEKKDLKAEKRSAEAFLSKKEGALSAAGGAAFGVGLAAGLAAVISARKKK